MGYTTSIPNELAVKLEAKGYEIDWEDCSTVEHPEPDRHAITCFAEVFDWLMQKDITILISHPWDPVLIGWSKNWHWGLIQGDFYEITQNSNLAKRDWDDIAVAAIEKAIGLL